MGWDMTVPVLRELAAAVRSRRALFALGDPGSRLLKRLSNRPVDHLAPVVREVGRQAVLAPGDISEEGHCCSLVERTVSELERLDILAKSAGYQMTREGIAQIPDGEWEHTFRTNVSCPQYCPVVRLRWMDRDLISLAGD